MSEPTTEKKQEYGYDYAPTLLAVILFAVIIVGMLNYNQGLNQQKLIENLTKNQETQDRTLAGIQNQTNEIHSALWQQINDAKARDAINNIPLADARKVTNESISYTKDKILLVTSPSCTICEDQENILKKMGISYSKVCMRLNAMDPADCERQGYIPWDKSQYLISDYNIAAVPTLIINTTKTRTGMIYWDLAKEEKDLRTIL